ncbi:integrase family protein [Brucella intermedia]|uniref:integrase family protein n=1 Tax=Brucella intermedia TaxID=94625 RepID=UPI000EFCE133|nr:integrase family protein [Brucella intermedia]KAB2720368.1 integrase family protein [Brucella intermedia]
MPTNRVEIGPKHIAEAKEAAEARAYTSRDPLIFADVVEKGLQLRIQAASVTWILKWSGKTKSLGDLESVTNAKAARERAQKVRNLLRDGTDPKAFLTGKDAGKSEAAAKAAAKQQTALAAGFWTWERLIDEYADNHLGKPRLSRGRLKPPSLDSAKGARTALTTPEADILKGKLVSELDIGDIEEVRDACAANGRPSASRAFVRNAKAALTHAKKMHSRKSGLEGRPKWWLEVQILHSTAVQPKTRMPTVNELARVLYMAEKHRTLEGRKNSRATTETMLCGLWWIALTAQRTNAALAIEKANIFPWPAEDHGPANGWKVAAWAEEDMKSKRFHSLPIPPRLVLLVERAIAAGREGSKYLFPSTALRKGKDDGHLDKNSPKNLIERLRGKRANPKGGKASAATGVDLLEGIPHFSQHDIRRTFTTTCVNLAIRGDATSAVLDHAGLETGQEMMRSADVTLLAYDLSQRLVLKRIAMEAWTNRLFAECDKVWRQSHPHFATPGETTMKKLDWDRIDFANLQQGVPFSPAAPWYEIMEEAAARKRPNRPDGPLRLVQTQKQDELEEF